LQQCKDLGLAEEDARTKSFQQQLVADFYNGCLFREQKEGEQVSLDSHCFILCRPQLLPMIDGKKTYEALKASPLWCDALIPGIPVSPLHPDNTVSWTTKIVGLRHYHDLLHWGWLVAEAAKTAKLQSDEMEYQRIVNEFSKAISKNEFVAEIYSTKEGELTPFQSLLYRSESPFTWSAAKWLEAISS
jgi:hypothetical protein